MASSHNLLDLVHQCRDELNLDAQINILYKINESLPESSRIKIPSLLTNDYLSRALDIIEDRLIDCEEQQKMSSVT